MRRVKEGHASSSSHSVPQGIYWGDQRRIRDVMGANLSSPNH